MKSYLQHHAWNIIEEGYHPEFNEVTESCFSLGNGHMMHRAIFEEQYSGQTWQGSYMAGLYHYIHSAKRIACPEYQTQTLNAPDWIGIDVLIDGEVLDLATCKIKEFRRVLNMKEGFLERSFTVRLVSGKELRAKSKRFCSLNNPELGAIRYAIKPLNFEGSLSITPYIDGDLIPLQQGNTSAKLWAEFEKGVKRRSGYLVTETKNSGIRVCTGMRFSIFKNKQDFDFITSQSMEENYVACTVDVKCKANDEIVIYKYAGVVSSVDHPIRKLPGTCKKLLKKVSKKGFSQLLREQADAWASIWEQADVEIEGDVATQQAIRFSIFHLFQSFSGINGWLGSGLHNTATNDGSKGIHWSMEIFCLPFFQATSASEAGIARNLLIHRYNHLAKAIENAAGMRFSDGAALYPLTTMNGEECSGSSWETVFEEIHRNSIVAYAIFNYIRWGGDSSFLAGYGLEILIALARFWSQRVHWSEPKNKYVINGAKGPNAYECNVNNNWHTNYLAGWCLRYTSQVVALMKQSDPGVYTAISQKINFVEEVELPRWQVVYENLYLPSDEMRGILLQQDDFLEKEQLSVDSLKAEERPLYQHWSWDKIVRSCFIEQADVLLGMYLFSENFELETIRRNFDFYEPKTVHESPLSFCTHAILAARLGYMDKALELMKKSTRLDLDDLKNETKNGLHITSMAGNWLIITQGFGGMKVKEDTLSFHPVLPPAWESYTFKIRWKECQMKVQVNRETTTVFNLSDQPLTLEVFGKKETIANLSDMSFSNTTT